MALKGKSRGIGKAPVVGDGAARSVAAPGPGFADVTTTTTDEVVDLTQYAGVYVRIQVTGDDHYVSFQEATGGTNSTAANALDASGFFQDDDIPEIIPANEYRDYVVPRKRPFLTYRSVSTTGGAIRIWRS